MFAAVSLLAALACVLALSTIASCAEEAPQDVGTSQPADRFGVLTISYSEHRVPGGTEPQVVVGGLFARHAGMPRDEVIHTLNLPDVPDAALLELKLGSCEYVDRNLSIEPGADGNAFVDLLDAGDIRLRFQMRTERLARRSVPDLFSNVTGITYEGVLHDAAAPILAGPVRVESRGPHEVGSFLVDVNAPPVPRLLEVSGERTSGSYAPIDWDANLEIRWLPAETRPDNSNRVYIELVALQYDRIVSLRCATRDDGFAGLPRDGVAAVGRAVTPDSTVRLITRRIARADFGAAGLHTGLVFFVSRDSVLLE